MKFRAKVLLAVLAPAAVLVAASLSWGLGRINTLSSEAARREFEGARSALQLVLEERSRQLGDMRDSFQVHPRLDGMISAADESGGGAELQQDLSEFYAAVQLFPAFYVIRGRKQQLLARHSGWHQCGATCRHPAEETAWVDRESASLGEADGRPCMAVSVIFPKGVFIVGLDVMPDLDRLAGSLKLKILLLDGERRIYASDPALPLMPADGSETVIGGARHRVRMDGIGGETLRSRLKLLLFRTTEVEDEQRRGAWMTALAGFGIAGAAAALVSALLARGISRPVEALVGATQSVARGDFNTRVDIPGRDEMARLGTAFNDMTAGLRKRQEIMNKTLSRDVAEQLMTTDALGGQRRQVTIMFMDVRGFTSTTEGMDPAEVVDMLNSVLDRLAGAIARNQGNVNKYLGDGIMAMFGAPKDDPDHAFHAVQAAIEMQKAIGEWSAERIKAGRGSLRIGIGVNTGTVLAGNVGSRERLEYTLIGEEVNLTSRICGKAGPGQVYVTKTTFDRLGGRIPGKPLDPINVKGLSYPIPVFLVGEA